ncbi:TPA: hypothetical protein QDB21_005635 [Burkholderia vietnamiensis]|nr:hypothetical protein [Burkholderia vietnamiensis]
MKQTIGATKPVIPQPQEYGEPLKALPWWRAYRADAILAVICAFVFVAGMFAGHFGVKPACEPAQQSRVYQA